MSERIHLFFKSLVSFLGYFLLPGSVIIMLILRMFCSLPCILRKFTYLKPSERNDWGLAKPHTSTHPHTHMYPYTQSSKSKHIVLKNLENWA